LIRLFSFAASRWLDEDEGDGKTSIDLVPSSKPSTDSNQNNMNGAKETKSSSIYFQKIALTKCK
jgi:hypothetical protein